MATSNLQFRILNLEPGALDPPITRLLYRCPRCGAEPWLEAGRCRGCGARVRLDRHRRTIVIGGHSADMAHWYAAVRSLDPIPAGGLDGGPVAVSVEVRRGLFQGAGGLRAVRYGRRRLEEARLHLDAQRLEIRGERLQLAVPLGEMTAVTIESHTVIVGTRTQGVFFLDFPQGAGKRWEDALAGALAAFYSPRRIFEYCPRLCFQDRVKPQDPAGPGSAVSLTARSRPVGCGPTPAAFEAVRLVLRRLLCAALPLRIEGGMHVPAAGPVIIAANHSSFLDAILLAAAAPRPIWFMTKNSQFDHRLLDRLLVWARAFPVRRYTTDAVAVRNALRILAAREVLGLFPEGERCWDGRLQPFKRTTLRLMLAAGVPVVPVGISGAYPLMPRWSSRVGRGTVTVRFGAPLDLPGVDVRDQRPHQILAAGEKLRSALLELI